MSRWLGVHLKDDGGLPNRDLLDCARLADRLGYSGVTVNEDIGHDALALLAAAARESERIGLGTAIVNCYTRSAMQIAMGIATVDDLSAGRATLGISVGHHPWNDQYHGIPLEAPLPRLREYVTFIRGVLSGDVYRHDGRFFTGVETRLGFHPFRTDLPIHIGGDRKGILKLAGEVADGAIMNVVDADYVASFAADRFFSAAAAAGRDPAALDLTVIVTCCLTDDRAEALARAKRAFLRRVASSATKLMDTRGAEAKQEIASLVALLEKGEAERAEEEISDDLVTGTIAIGSAEEIRAAVDRYYRAGATRVLLAASPLTKGHIEELLHALAPLPVTTVTS